MLTVLVLSLLLSSCFEAEVPHIGENGNWFIGDTDTGVPANGADGAKGEKGDTGDSGKDGDKGEVGDSIDGDMPTVTAYEKLRDTENGAVYKISFSDGKSAEITVTNGIDGAASEETVEVSGIISSFTTIPSGEHYKQASLASGSKLIFPKDKYSIASSRRIISAYMKLGELGDGKIYIGQGKDELGGSYVEITKTTLTVFTNVADASEPYYIDAKHKIANVKDYIYVVIDSSYGQVDVSFMSASGLFEKNEAFWSGSAGDIFIEAVGVELSDVNMSVATAGYTENVWIFADMTPRSNYLENTVSYFNRQHYFDKRNYDDNLLIATPGLTSTLALAEFNRALAKGTPKYAIWAVGGNEADSSGNVNAEYAANTASFLAKCAELGITPILSTHPNTESCDNSAKNAYVAGSGQLYCDFAGKLGAKDSGDTVLDDEFYTGEGDARTLDFGAIARAEFSEFVRLVPEIALNKD